MPIICLIGHFLDVATLGIYVLAFSLTDQIILGISWAASQALFPAYGAIQADLPALRRSYEDSLTAIAALTLPAAAGLAIVAEPLVQVLYGEKWSQVIPVVQVLAIYAMVHSVAFNLGDLFKATGRPWVLTWTNVLALMCAPAVAVVSTRWGIIGFAVGQIGLMAAILDPAPRDRRSACRHRPKDLSSSSAVAAAIHLGNGRRNDWGRQVRPH